MFPEEVSFFSLSVPFQKGKLGALLQPCVSFSCKHTAEYSHDADVAPNTITTDLRSLPNSQLGTHADHDPLFFLKKKKKKEIRHACCVPSNFAGVLAFGSQNISRFSVFLFYTYLLRYTIRTPRAMNPYADSDTTHGLLSPASFSRCQSRAPRRRPAGSHHVQQTCKECHRFSLIDLGLWWTLKTTPLHCRTQWLNGASCFFPFY